jgi:hypothetical protein
MDVYLWMDYEEDAAVFLLIHAVISQSSSEQYNAVKPL